MTDNGMTDYSWFFQSAARACLDALGRDIRVDLERQVNDLESVPAEDLVPLLPQVTKRTDEIEPVQDSARPGGARMWMSLAFM